MIEVVRKKPCTDCGIKGLYEKCEEKCVQYRKWYQYQQGKEDAIKELLQNSGKYIFYMDKYCDFEGHALSLDNLNKLARELREE